MLPLLVVVAGLGLVLWKKTVKALVIAATVVVTFAIIYSKIQPSYLPKGDIQRSDIPGFEPSKAEIEDRNRKPVPSEVRQERMEAEYRQGTVH